MSNDKKQTAIEWLVDELLSGKILMHTLIEQAKAMEKGQIKDAWVYGNNNFDEHGIGSDRYAISDESFYNETYGGDK
jgi:hypothetical protein